MSAPLIDKYRKMATFDWRKLKAAVEGEEHAEVVAKMKSEPVFQRDFRVLSREEHREVVHQRWKKIVEWGLFKDPYSDLENFHALTETLEAYDQGTSARLFLHGNVFGAAVKSMGTERHKELVQQIENNEIVGAFCLTEIGHGSNTAEIQTTATFDNGQLVFNTPDVGAIKCWAGNVSHSATHVVVYAQLHVGGKNEGFHGFVIQVRCPKTFQTLPGITIGDMGSKPGCWQGVENGWIEFKNHRAPLSALLNKGCDITPDGKYVTSFKSASEKQSVSLGTLSVGRLGIIAKGMMACTFASTIAIRYSVARRQFGPEKGAENEIPVLEYPLQQYRLFPYLSAAICIRIFQKTFVEKFTEYMMRVMMGEKSEELSEFSKEVHALSSGAKPVATWLGVESLGEARKACGGHGFLHMSRLNTLRDDNDPSQTFEGENFMILQQTSNILLGKVSSIGTINTPMSTMSFLNSNPSKFSSWSSNPVDDALSAYRYLTYHLLQTTSSEAKKLKGAGKNSFEVRNEIQVHRAVNLSVAYTEHTMIDWVQKFIEEVEDVTVKTVLQKVLNLFSLFLLERHLATLYITGYASGGKFGEDLREKLRHAVAELKPESMALVDSIAPDDFILHSALGASDGRAYDHIMEEFRKYTNEQPKWVCDLAQFLQKRSQTSKL
ncbi:hypothetical protein GCK72_013669 [Caenorhabditis remanei]|uniref:Acyl-coenzyme A oxidase n=1 Tax=Caenorhabditis remanei TaxID=31234 RepID=A0A6A5GRF4_CAERE|nr:hypothetical protein GCK72_013669 [Caenorhabditis remanei]KAF1757214.1 hypothetical protein GCK72_013669 [Caenorhabditis remanei]